MALYQRKKVSGMQGQGFTLLIMPILAAIFSTENVCYWAGCKYGRML